MVVNSSQNKPYPVGTTASGGVRMSDGSVTYPASNSGGFTPNTGGGMSSRGSVYIGGGYSGGVYQAPAAVQTVDPAIAARIAAEQKKREEEAARQAKISEARAMWGKFTPTGQSVFQRQQEAQSLTENELMSRSKVTIASANLSKRVAVRSYTDPTPNTPDMIVQDMGNGTSRTESGRIVNNADPWKTGKSQPGTAAEFNPFETIFLGGAGLVRMGTKTVAKGFTQSTAKTATSIYAKEAPTFFTPIKTAVSNIPLGRGTYAPTIGNLFSGITESTAGQAVKTVSSKIPLPVKQIGSGLGLWGLGTQTADITGAAVQTTKPSLTGINVATDPRINEARQTALTERDKFFDQTQKNTQTGEITQAFGKFPSFERTVKNPIDLGPSFLTGFAYQGLPGLQTATETELAAAQRTVFEKELRTKGFTQTQAKDIVDVDFARRGFGLLAGQISIEAGSNMIGAPITKQTLKLTGTKTAARRFLGFGAGTALGPAPGEGILQTITEAQAEGKTATREQIAQSALFGTMTGFTFSGLQGATLPSKTGRTVVSTAINVSDLGEYPGDVFTSQLSKRGWLPEDTIKVNVRSGSLMSIFGGQPTQTGTPTKTGIRSSTPTKTKGSKTTTPANIPQPSQSSVPTPSDIFVGLPTSPGRPVGGQTPTGVFNQIFIEADPVPVETESQSSVSAFASVESSVGVPVKTGGFPILPPLFGFGESPTKTGRPERTDYYNELSVALNTLTGPSSYKPKKSLKKKRKK